MLTPFLSFFSQLAKDVVTFLSWSASKELDERKRLTVKVREK